MDQENVEAVVGAIPSSENLASHLEIKHVELVEPCNLPNVGESERKEEVGTDVASLVDDCVSACAVADLENEIAVGCNAETPLYSHNVQFTELPVLVFEHIVKHLDTPAKLALRLVCHTTKHWVENSKFLVLFRIPVTSNEMLTHLVKCAKSFPDTKWKTISFFESNFANYNCFPSFVSMLSDHISNLHLHHFNASLAQILFLSSCENLESLKIDEMDLRENPALVIASDKTLKAKCPKLLDIFTELRELSIGIIYFNDVKHLPFYQTFLQRCRKLELLNVPRTQGPSTISWESLKGIQLKHIIGPIKEYFQKKPITSPLKTDIKILDVSGLFSRHFPVVAEACVQIGSATKFDKVNEKHVKYLFTHEGDILQRILSLHEKIDDRRHIMKWESLQSLYVRSSRCDIRNDYAGHATFPKLETLTIVMDSRSRDDPNFSMLERLIRLLVLTPREHLRTFVLQWPLFAHDTPQDYIRASHFVANFYNLTKLRISGWTAPDDDYLLIFEILYSLKELILEECLNLTDWGLLGFPDLACPAILNLRDLTRLEIRNRNNPGYVTDACFEKAFRHMRINYFLLDSVHATNNGYNFLTDGEFSATIRKIFVPHTLPRGILTEEDFNIFLAANFPNIIL